MLKTTIQCYLPSKESSKSVNGTGFHLHRDSVADLRRLTGDRTDGRRFLKGARDFGRDEPTVRRNACGIIQNGRLNVQKLSFGIVLHRQNAEFGSLFTKGICNCDSGVACPQGSVYCFSP
ncbi:hypothetical protein R1flu_027680 [Riccia fluitans]|uniref:Uncharacterized protein n=1 Tax=Riccia fluitans TaxID=41844 RepID=A0ABD1XJJ0_9MARC